MLYATLSGKPERFDCAPECLLQPALSLLCNDFLLTLILLVDEVCVESFELKVEVGSLQR